MGEHSQDRCGRVRKRRVMSALMCRDIGHSRAVHEKDVPFLMDHRERLIHFHIHDGTETPPRNHLALGNGEIDLQARLQLARERGARCVLETKTVAALKHSVQWLRDNWEV